MTSPLTLLFEWEVTEPWSINFVVDKVDVSAMTDQLVP